MTINSSACLNKSTVFPEDSQDKSRVFQEDTPGESNVSQKKETLDKTNISQNNNSQNFFDYRAFAKKQHNLKIVYLLYAALDGLSVSYSALKCFFDLFLISPLLSSADAIHEWLATGFGLLEAVTGSITLVTLAILASYFDNATERFKAAIAAVGPYIRDVMKALRDAYKGLKSLFQTFNHYGKNLTQFLSPVGALLGLTTMLNRLVCRLLIGVRKKLMKFYAEELKKTQQCASDQLSYDQINNYLATIKTHNSQQKKLLRFLLTALGGLTDSLYLYVGIIPLVYVGALSLIPAVVFIITAITAMLIIACVATRLYEEYVYQCQLEAAQTKVILTLSGKLLEKQLLSLNLSSSTTIDQINDFRQYSTKLRASFTLSPMAAFLAGLKIGLAGYGSMTSMILAVDIFLTISTIPFPPVLLITAISLGLASLIYSIRSGLNAAQEMRTKQQQAQEAFDKRCDLLIEQLECTSYPSKESLQTEMKQLIETGLAVEPPPASFNHSDIFEMIRAFFSGLGKGIKIIEYLGNAWQTTENTGHFHTSMKMLPLVILTGLLHGALFLFNAFVRLFGKPPITQQLISSASSIEKEKTLPNNNIELISTPQPTQIETPHQTPDKASNETPYQTPDEISNETPQEDPPSSLTSSVCSNASTTISRCRTPLDQSEIMLRTPTTFADQSNEDSDNEKDSCDNIDEEFGIPYCMNKYTFFAHTSNHPDTLPFRMSQYLNVK